MWKVTPSAVIQVGKLSAVPINPDEKGEKKKKKRHRLHLVEDLPSMSAAVLGTSL